MTQPPNNQPNPYTPDSHPQNPAHGAANGAQANPLENQPNQPNQANAHAASQDGHDKAKKGKGGLIGKVLVALLIGALFIGWRYQDQMDFLPWNLAAGDCMKDFGATSTDSPNDLKVDCGDSEAAYKVTSIHKDVLSADACKDDKEATEAFTYEQTGRGSFKRTYCVTDAK